MSYKDQMHPSVSNAELEVFKELSKRGLTKGMITQKPIILKMTIPDFTWEEKRVAVYLDGTQAHAKRQEKDEEITNLLENKGWTVLRIPYFAPLTQKRLIEILAEIQAIIGER